MIRNQLIKQLSLFNRGIFTARNSSSQINIKNLEEESTSEVDVVDEELKQREEEIEKKRNKSRLRLADRRVLLEQNPYPEPMLWHHGTLKYVRKSYGKFGSSSGVDPSLCWPTKKELDEKIEFESIQHPFTIPQMVAEAKQKRQEKEERVRKRQEEIGKKMETLEFLKQDLFNRIAKKENEANAAKDRKERLIEEVKRHFGYAVDPKDEKFKEMLEKKEKEQKKAIKEAKRKAKEEKLVQKLLKKKEPSEENTDEKASEKKEE